MNWAVVGLPVVGSAEKGAENLHRHHKTDRNKQDDRKRKNEKQTRQKETRQLIHKNGKQKIACPPRRAEKTLLLFFFAIWGSGDFYQEAQAQNLH